MQLGNEEPDFARRGFDLFIAGMQKDQDPLVRLHWGRTGRLIVNRPDLGAPTEGAIRHDLTARRESDRRRGRRVGLPCLPNRPPRAQSGKRLAECVVQQVGNSADVFERFLRRSLATGNVQALLAWPYLPGKEILTGTDIDRQADSAARYYRLYQQVIEVLKTGAATHS